MRLSIRSKLIGGAALILIAMAIVGWRGIVGMRDINKDLNDIKACQFMPTLMIADTNNAIMAWNRATLNHVLADTVEKMDVYDRIMLEKKALLLERLGQLSNVEHLSKRGKELVHELLDEFSRAEPIRDRVVMLSRSGKQEEARRLIRKELRPIVDQIGAHKAEFIQMQKRQLDRVIKATDERYVKGFRRISWLVVISLLLSIFIAFSVNRDILKSLNEMVRGSKSAAGGDLSRARVTIQSKDEFGYLGGVFNDMLESLEKNLSKREQVEKDLKEYAKRLEETVEELRATQEQLVRREKLAILGQLASGISHELRNPLGVIGNSVYYLNMKLKDADEKVARHLTILQREVQRADEIITDLLDFARTKQPSFVKADIAEVVEDALAGIEIPEGIAVETNFEVELPPILIDPGQIRRVFLNLISNAVRAMPEGGRLEIGTGVRDEFVEIIFRDTGQGIAKEDLTKIFEPLFSTMAKGVGLGLAMVKGIVDQYKGMIAVESEIGTGTTITVKLPLCGKEEV